MENKAGNYKKENDKPKQVHQEIQSVFEGQKIVARLDIEKDLNAKILEITMVIRDKYPELLKYLDEMPMTVPTEKDPEITLKNLNIYYDSLNAILTKYKLEHS
jgi:hypothetical protein